MIRVLRTEKYYSDCIELDGVERRNGDTYSFCDKLLVTSNKEEYYCRLTGKFKKTPKELFEHCPYKIYVEE